ncbi:ferritin family protein [Desulfosporosinus sp. PR]|uniref:ferritin-like domain-containing protein n=1 Tax=Candidatus Desulfosporosinus nitrosoreducens TaxID=3401928 RepID=UPI0027F9E206|nr:ferritin family protein [Desulfosporosinus sp. PR]MDQ7096439.1 ferritin family protein [Desulfosporosinus sp. PR]
MTTNSYSFKDVIAFAIKNEVDSYEFYHNMAKKITSDSNLADTFEELAIEEQKHRDYLQDYLEGEIPEIQLADFEDYHVSESVAEPKLTEDIKFVDAIVLAMKKEEQAMNMYKKLALLSTDDRQKELFSDLSRIEEMHKVKLEKIYVNAAYVEVW